MSTSAPRENDYTPLLVFFAVNLTGIIIVCVLLFVKQCKETAQESEAMTMSSTSDQDLLEDQA